MSAIAQALTDKDFLNATPDDQKKYLAHIDHDFGKASDKDQQGYLNHILSPGRLQRAAQPTQFERDINSQRGVTSAYDPNANGVVQRGLGAVGGAVMGAIPAAVNSALDPVGTIKGIGSSIADWADPKTRPTWEGIKSVLPEALGMGIGNVAAGEMAGAAPGAATATKGAVGNILRDPYGKLKPGVKAISSIGKYVGVPEIADWMVPNRSTGPVGPYSPLSNILPKSVQGDPFSPPAPPAAEPELGSPENPGFMSKLPARLPPNLRGDPFSPSAPPQQVAPGVEAPSADVMRLPVPREPAPGENPNYAASIPRKDLEDLALQKKPGAGDQLRNIGKTVLYVPESYPGPRAADAYAPPVDVPDEMPQGNATPFSPTARMLMPRKKLVLQ